MNVGVLSVKLGKICSCGYGVQNIGLLSEKKFNVLIVLDVTRFYNKITVIIIKRLYTEKYLNSMLEYRTLQTKQAQKPRRLLCEIRSMNLFGPVQVQGGSNMIGTNCD